MDTIYVEESVRHHPRAEAILDRYPNARRISCQRYGEVFNPKAQNFRLQKQNPSLILAEKYQRWVLPAPEGYGIGGTRNFYFSHMLNCVYDCRYCFLQGMYQSANYVLFVNYEDFQDEIRRLAEETSESTYFFSGYDCDSLAFEPVTGFAASFLLFFSTLPETAWLELRTKSTQVRHLLEREPLKRCVVAFSLSPDEVAQKLELGAPSLAKRLKAAKQCQEQGWPIGLRFDPIIYQTGFQAIYRQFFEQVFKVIDAASVHSVSLGTFRLPEAYFKKIHKLYPEERLFASPLDTEKGLVTYRKPLEQALMDEVTELLLQYVTPSQLFPCGS